MKRLLIALLIASTIVLSGCSKTGIPECDWQPKNNYGPCEAFMEFVYFNQEKGKCEATAISGCKAPESPFNKYIKNSDDQKIIECQSNSDASEYSRCVTEIKFGEAIKACQMKCEGQK